MADAIRVLIVDDSRIFRGVLEEALRGIPQAQVVGSVWSGEKALEHLGRAPADLVTLDLAMPGLNGLQTLEAIQSFNRAHPERAPVEVLLISAFTPRGAAVSIEALQAGALDCVPKPNSKDVAESRAYLRRALSGTIHLLLGRKTQAAPPALPSRVDSGIFHRLPRLRAIFIGVSTGGPAALAQILPDLTSRVELPIVIVQHLPVGFSGFLAESLARKCAVPVTEATDGDLVESAHVYLAAGQRHTLIRAEGSRLALAQNDQPPEQGSRPSVDVLFRSAATALGVAAVGVILTGMGKDGTSGLGALKRAGAYTIAQDEASSVVWGMPGSAVAAGCVDIVLPLDRIAAAVALRAERGS